MPQFFSNKIERMVAQKVGSARMSVGGGKMSEMSGSSSKVRVIGGGEVEVFNELKRSSNERKIGGEVE